MKNNTFVILLFCFMVHSAFASHTTTSFPVITVKDVPAEKKFSVNIEGLKEAAILELKDANGDVLLKQEINKGPFAKVFNLEQLPEGAYYFHITTGLKETVQPIDLKETGAYIDSSKQKEYYAPVIQVKDGYIDLSLYNNKISDVQITIVNKKNGFELVRENLENVLVVERRYRLEDLPFGGYLFQVKTAHKTYYQDFRIK
ncbi:MAG TPA: hypothetical protein PKA00_08125 [Saprospiraceae bacterium]|nr:hypothetical protein [Saprospiraceae bacterium]HMQ82860.1 hypothetical protein [Saprospiraceae bacterium]